MHTHHNTHFFAPTKNEIRLYFKTTAFTAVISIYYIFPSKNLSRLQAALLSSLPILEQDLFHARLNRIHTDDAIKKHCKLNRLHSLYSCTDVTKQALATMSPKRDKKFGISMQNSCSTRLILIMVYEGLFNTNYIAC